MDKLYAGTLVLLPRSYQGAALLLNLAPDQDVMGRAQAPRVSLTRRSQGGLPGGRLVGLRKQVHMPRSPGPSLSGYGSCSLSLLDGPPRRDQTCAMGGLGNWAVSLNARWWDRS